MFQLASSAISLTSLASLSQKLGFVHLTSFASRHDAHDHDDHDHGSHDDHDDLGHDDQGNHDHSHDFRDASRRSLLIALALITSYMIAEVIGGLFSGSLALLADAGHMLTDAAAIAMALIAMWIAQRPASIERTFGYHRAEILAALANTFALWLIAGWILYEAFQRAFGREEVGDIHGMTVLFGGHRRPIGKPCRSMDTSSLLGAQP